MTTKGSPSLLTLLILIGAWNMAPAQTQVDLTQISCSKYKNAEKGLNRTFNQILKAHDSEPKFTKAFQEAHRTRLIFRNAHIRSFYPGSSLSPVSDNPSSADYGSVYPMCACDLQTEITSQRIKQLRAIWVVGIEAGNVCGESAAVNPARSGSRDK